MSTTTARIYNFSSGPAVLPVPVLEQIQRDLVMLPGVGMSILEVSHRSKVFEEVIQQAEADIRALANVPANYKVLFLQGGASLQFSMVPLNLLTAGATADYIITGSWTDKAAKEARKVGNVNIAASTEADNFTRIPTQDELKLTPDAAYVHITSNNTIEGTQWHALPDVGGAPLVSDASSDLFCRPIDISKYGLIYAGAQKNLGPSGATLVIIREDLLARSAKSLHTMLNYAVHAENGSLYNTPPCFAIYNLGLVMRVAARPRRARRHRRGQRPEGRQAVRRARPHGLLASDGPQRRSVGDERDLPAGDRGSREEVREGIHRRRLRRPQGPPVGRRHARVDLQRVPGRRRRRAGRVHAGVRAEERLGRTITMARWRDGAMTDLVSLTARSAPSRLRRLRDCHATGGPRRRPRRLRRLASFRRLVRQIFLRDDRAFVKALPVLEDVRRLAVDLEPRERLAERPAVHQRALGPR